MYIYDYTELWDLWEYEHLTQEEFHDEQQYHEDRIEYYIMQGEAPLIPSDVHPAVVEETLRSLVLPQSHSTIIENQHTTDTTEYALRQRLVMEWKHNRQIWWHDQHRLADEANTCTCGSEILYTGPGLLCKATLIDMVKKQGRW